MTDMAKRFFNSKNLKDAHTSVGRGLIKQTTVPHMTKHYTTIKKTREVCGSHWKKLPRYINGKVASQSRATKHSSYKRKLYIMQKIIFLKAQKHPNYYLFLGM